MSGVNDYLYYRSRLAPFETGRSQGMPPDEAYTPPRHGGTPMATTTVTERTYTNLERALYAPSFRQALTTLFGRPEQADAFIVEVMNQARQVPGLHRCTIDSIRFHLIRIARLQLDPALPNEVFFIPRDLKQADGTSALELTIQYGYGGLRKLIMRSPEVRDCFTKEVCVNDRYVPPATPVDLPIHLPPAAFAPRGRVIGYYAALQTQVGNWRTLAMSVAEVEAHAKRYGGGTLGPAWSKGKRPDTQDGLCPFDKMALKTCLRMLCNGRDVALTAEVSHALTLETAEAVRETAAQRQGYDRAGQRPALPMDTGGVSLEDLGQDLTGARDVVEVDAHLQRETRRPPAQAPAHAVPDPPREGPQQPREGTQSPGGVPRDIPTVHVPLAAPRGLQGGVQEGLAWETLRAHQDDARLPAEVRAQVRTALSADEPATDSEAHALAGAVLEWLDAAGEEG